MEENEKSTTDEPKDEPPVDASEETDTDDTDDTDAEPESESESPESGVEDDADKPRWTKRALRWAAVAAVAAVVAVAGWEGWLLYQNRQTDVAAEQALDAATKYAVVLTSIDTNALDQNFTEVLDGSTGEFKDMYTKSSTQLRQLLVDNKAAAHGVVIDAAVKSATNGQGRGAAFRRPVGEQRGRARSADRPQPDQDDDGEAGRPVAGQQGRVAVNWRREWPRSSIRLASLASPLSPAAPAAASLTAEFAMSCGECGRHLTAQRRVLSRSASAADDCLRRPCHDADCDRSTSADVPPSAATVHVVWHTDCGHGPLPSRTHPEDAEPPGIVMTPGRFLRGTELLDGDRSACGLELALGFLGGFLGDLLEQRLGSAVDEVLGLLEAQAGDDLADDLDDADLLLAGTLEDDVELGLLLGGLGRAPPAAGPAAATATGAAAVTSKVSSNFLTNSESSSSVSSLNASSRSSVDSLAMIGPS